MQSTGLFDRSHYARSVSAILARYLDVFPEEQTRLGELLLLLQDGGASLCSPDNLPGHLTASGLVLQRPLRSALLIHHNFLQRWLQPGGHMEPLEHPQEGALREVREEVGHLSLSLAPWHNEKGIPLDVDSHLIPENRTKGKPAHTHHDFLYLFELNRYTDVVLQEEEVSSYAWISLEELAAGRCGQRLARAVCKLERIWQEEAAK